MAEKIDFYIGTVDVIPFLLPKKLPESSFFIQGKVIHVRQSRHLRHTSPLNTEKDSLPDRRVSIRNMDPFNSKTLTILVPEGERLPDLSSAEYEIVMRFKKIKKN